MRAALYARYSTDQQRATSIEDQLRLGRARAIAEGDADPLVYSDAEISGQLPIESRPGGRQLVADAVAGRFELLVLEALDRFSRDLVDQERTVRRLEFLRVRIIGLADGYDSAQRGRELIRGIRGAVNQEQARVTGEKVHRGLTGQIARGYHAGGISYGYRSSVAGVDARGEPIGHRLEVEPAAAEIVRWIFARYGEGWSLRAIVRDLNRRRIPSPRRSSWAITALYGAPAKGSGILNNELYIGRYIWNRSQWLRDPDTRRRKRFARPRAEWAIEERPELCIIDAEAWQLARARLDGPRRAGGSRGKGARPRTLFGGLLVCGRCGGPVNAVSQWSYGCAANKARGAEICAGLFVNRKDLEARVLSLVRNELLGPEALAALQLEIQRRLAQRQRDRDQAAAPARGRLAELEREIEHLVDAVARSGLSEALRTRLAAAEAERVRLQAHTPASARNAPSASPGAILARYRKLVLDLKGALERDTPRARGLLRELLGEIRLAPEDGKIYAELEDQGIKLLCAAGASPGMVAGTRYLTRHRIRVR